MEPLITGSLSAAPLFKTLIVGLLSAFVPATAYTFLRVRLKKKDIQFKNTIQILGINDAQSRLITPSVLDEYSARDYYLPTTFLSFLCLAGFVSFFFDTEILSINPDKRELFLIGLQSVDINPKQILVLREQAFLAITMGFIGAFVWSAENIIRRLISCDLAPSTYYSAAIRIIFAVLTALIMVFIFRTDPGDDHYTGVIPVCAFLSGMMPEQALNYIKDKSRVFIRKTMESADELNLDMIEGMNLFHKSRLSEISIDNCQNLAEANLIELVLKTPFNANQLIDWIVQAKLYLYVKSDFPKLRAAGIRNAFDLLYTNQDNEETKEIAKKAGIDELTLRIIARHLNEDVGIQRLRIFRQRLASLGDQQTGEPSQAS